MINLIIAKLEIFRIRIKIYFKENVLLSHLAIYPYDFVIVSKTGSPYKSMQVVIISDI